VSIVAKGATDSARFRRRILPTPNARSGLRLLLESLAIPAEGAVLLPAYIGWSPKEGSGVFDPIREVGCRFHFYRVTRELTIDVDDLHAHLSCGDVRVLLLIHYFGWPDPALADIAALARSKGVILVEDEAHALFSDWIGGSCGRFGDAVLYSLHKMLPLKSGGLLALNEDSELYASLSTISTHPTRNSLLDYDLWSIARARRKNAQALLEYLRPLSDDVTPLYAGVPDGIIPQTLPVILRTRSRDDLYFALNKQGYGVVSLYHTLIEAISRAQFPDSHWLADHILNLPVHQDARPNDLKSLVDALARLL
jgi:dTDP-4-amino-4,6-dideoxygalactose transaminase